MEWWFRLDANSISLWKRWTRLCKFYCVCFYGVKNRVVLVYQTSYSVLSELFEGIGKSIGFEWSTKDFKGKSEDITVYFKTYREKYYKVDRRFWVVSDFERGREHGFNITEMDRIGLSRYNSLTGFKAVRFWKQQHALKKAAWRLV